MTSDPVCCGGNTTIQEAAKLMAEHSIGALPVLNDAGEPMGIVTDRDICC
ncbi:CBS domain-containing protein, partial [Limimaricola sp. G21655-S1]|nr:CBS domain-containing protein [Limimaricola sp. G21655-S1]